MEGVEAKIKGVFLNRDGETFVLRNSPWAENWRKHHGKESLDILKIQQYVLTTRSCHV
jgi:hypothetical protein